MDERMQKLESYLVTLKTQGEKLPRQLKSEKPHFRMISSAAGIDFSYLVKEPYRQRIFLAAEEIGFAAMNGTRDFIREANFNQNRARLATYLRWLEERGIKLPEDPTYRGKIFFSQVAVEAELDAKNLALREPNGDRTYNYLLRQLVEKACPSLGLEVRVLPQHPGQQTRLTYETVMQRGTEERKQELKDKSSAKPQLYNTRSALNHFCKTFCLRETDQVGAEFVTKFPDSVERVIEQISNANSRKKFRTEIHWWHDFYQRLIKEPSISKDFHQALVHLIDRSGLSFAVLAKLIGVDNSSLASWYKGRISPTGINAEAFGRMEQLFKLPAGTLTDKITGRDRGRRFRSSDLPPFLREIRGKLRGVMKHLPDDFCSLPTDTQERIVESIRTEILRGDDDYGRRHMELVHLPYRLKVWPVRLRREVDAYAEFKMADRPPIGMQRNGKWRPATREKFEDDFTHFFGALSLPREHGDARLRGLGLPQSSLTLALITCPLVVDWYIRFKHGTRSTYTEYAPDMLRQLISMLRPSTGWLRQNPELASRLEEVDLTATNLIPRDLVIRAQSDWGEVCDSAIEYYKQLISELRPLITVSRDPFHRIEGIVDTDDPMQAMALLIQGMRNDLPSVHTQPVLHHTAVRNCALVLLLVVTGLRRNTAVQLNYTGGKGGHLYREGKWYVLSIPRRFFKEENSPFFGRRHNQKDYFMELPDVFGFYEVFDEYLNTSRPFLMDRYHKACKEQPLFINSAGSNLVGTTKTSARLKAKGVYRIYSGAAEMYLVENKWRGTGLPQVKRHGPHSVRHMRGTKAVKETGSFQIAADDNHNSEQMARRHYTRFLPRNRNRQVNKVLFNKEEDSDEDV